MSRGLTSALATALQDPNVNPIILLKMETTAGNVLVWTGLGDINWDGEVYKGIGDLGSVSEIVEQEDLGASGLTISLSGLETVPSGNVAIAISQLEHNRPAVVFFGAIDVTTGLLVADPYQIFAGFTDTASITDNGINSSIKISLENKMIDLDVPRTFRYTGEDQKIDYPDDLGFDFVPELQDTSIVWG